MILFSILTFIQTKFLWELFCDYPLFFISLFLFVLFLLYKFFLTIYFMRPITEKELEKWAKKELKKATTEYFKFEFEPPKSLKKQYESDKPLVDKDGSEITINIPFKYGPACMSYWLKHKKHQWIVAIYCKDKTNFTRLYGNKGPDNTTVSCSLRPESMFGIGRRNNFDSVLIFHNHPMSVSSNVSKEDREIAKIRKKFAKQNDWNYLEFICIRGDFKLFEENYNSKFKQISDYKKEYKELGKQSALQNLKFRWDKIY